MSNEYKYAGISLTPSIAAELLLESFSGSPITTEKARTFIVEKHEQQGGLPPNSTDLHSLVNKTFAVLKRYGAENPSMGHWRLPDNNGDIPIDDTLIELPPTGDIEDTDEPYETPLEELCDKVIGSCSGATYVYTYPSYIELAELKNETVLPYKIGATDRCPISRVNSQVGTALPEQPVITLVIKTDIPFKIEQALHLILTIRGKAKGDAPGAEWFLTNPDEIESIYRFIVGETDIQEDDE